MLTLHTAQIEAAKQATEKSRAAYLEEAGLTEKAAPVVVEMNPAERKLQQLVAVRSASEILR